MIDTLAFVKNNGYQTLLLVWEHTKIVGIAIVVASLVGVTLGIMITRHRVLAKTILNASNIVMTIPSLAMFGLMLPILSVFGYGLGKVPAVIALIIYSQLPIVRNTYAAISSINPAIIQAGKGLGMTNMRLLFEVELPICLPVIIAGIRTAAVMCIGIAAIATFIGAGGLGVYIQQGIERVYDEMVLAGAILVSLLAIVVEGALGLLQKVLTSKGIKVQKKLLC